MKIRPNEINPEIFLTKLTLIWNSTVFNNKNLYF